jgi:hypothetical protein
LEQRLLLLLEVYSVRQVRSHNTSSLTGELFGHLILIYHYHFLKHPPLLEVGCSVPLLLLPRADFLASLHQPHHCSNLHQRQGVCLVLLLQQNQVAFSGLPLPHRLVDYLDNLRPRQ